MLNRGVLKYFLPRIATSLRHRLCRPRLPPPASSYRHRPLSVLSPFMAIFSAGLLWRESQGQTGADGSLADVYEKCVKSVVYLRLEIKTDDKIQTRNIVSNGSGFIISEDGLILTNAHVVIDMGVKSKLKITYYDGRVVKGAVVCLDPLSDLALVKPSDSDGAAASCYPPLKLKTEHTVPSSRVGDRIFAVGSPFGLLNAMTSGIVSGLDRTIEDLKVSGRSINDGTQSKYSGLRSDSRLLYLQTDLHLFPGNSGGPIFDSSGQVIGISSVRSEAEGLSFGIQINSVLGILDQMLAQGRVRRLWLGFRGISLNHEIVEQIESVSQQTQLNTIKHGVLILKSYEGTPAAKAKLLPGDVIVAVNDQPVKDIGQFLAVLDAAKLDEAAKLEVKRIRILGREGLLRPSENSEIASFTCFVKPDEYDIFTHQEAL